MAGWVVNMGLDGVDVDYEVCDISFTSKQELSVDIILGLRRDEPGGRDC